MERFTRLRSVAAPIPQDNIDTDIIFPARFLLITERDGLGRYGFHDWRYDAQGHEIAGFPLASERWRDASIIVTGANFGCGSSREHAPWALTAMGVRAIIAPSFGDIFYGNCLRNGLLPIVAGPADHEKLMADAWAARPLVVDLAAGHIKRHDGSIVAFAIDPERRDALLNAWDEVDVILVRHSSAIAAFEAAQQRTQPWLWVRDRPEEGR